MRMAYTILIADDSAAAVRAAQAALPEPEFEVRTAADGAKAARSIEEDMPNALLAALSLPAKDGYELGVFLRSRPEAKTTVLLFLRGAVETLDVGRLAVIDHDGVVSKPFDGQSLAELIRRAIERRRELPSLPEEPTLRAAPPAAPASPTVPLEDGAGLAGTPLEEALRGFVREEFSRTEWESKMRGIAAAEFKKLLVAELRGVETGK
jgi:DNA-binding response OmpR family regulator